MIVAIVLGIVAGIAGFLPLFVGLRLSKRVTKTSNFGYASIVLLSMLVSLVVLVIATFVCITFARDVAFPFVLAEAIALCVSAIGFGVYRSVRK